MLLHVICSIINKSTYGASSACSSLVSSWSFGCGFSLQQLQNKSKYVLSSAEMRACNHWHLSILHYYTTVISTLLTNRLGSSVQRKSIIHCEAKVSKYKSTSQMYHKTLECFNMKQYHGKYIFQFPWVYNVKYT